MSGIAGVLRLDGARASSVDVRALEERMLHRAPDGRGHFLDGAAVISQLLTRADPGRPAIAEPARDPGTGVLLALDGRIDDRDALARRLDATSTTGDAELALRAYLAWGERAIRELLGDFGLAIFDPRERRLIIARDFIGAKPLYYRHAPGEFFAFASEIDALLTLGPTTLDVDWVRDFVGNYWSDQTGTIHREIRRLEGAHVLVLDAEGLRIGRYWDPAEFPQDTAMTLDRAAAEYRRLILLAVQDRLPSIGRVMAEVSGGLDSSAVACAARQLSHDLGIEAWTIYNGSVPQTDERAWARRVVAWAAIPIHHEHALDEGDRFATFARLQGRSGEPLRHFDEVRGIQVAAKSGIRVILTGSDGDATIGHGRGYVQQVAGRHPIRALRHALAVATRRGTPRWALAARWAILPALHAWTPRMALALVGRLRRRRNDPLTLPPSWWERPTRPTSESDERARLFRRIAGTNILSTCDLLASWEGVEYRHPFFDRRLVEHCLRVPGHHRIVDGHTRYFARVAYEGILPDDVRWRADKANFQPTLEHWFHEQQPAEAARRTERAIRSLGEHLRRAPSWAFEAYLATAVGDWLATHERPAPEEKHEALYEAEKVSSR